MKIFSFNITERMYEDIFSKKMASDFFDGLTFIGGNTFRIEMAESGWKTDRAGKSVPIYEREEVLTSILEHYGCNWQEDEDQTVDGGIRRPGVKKPRLNVPQVSW